MKFLSGMEPLQIDATPDGNGWSLNGKLAWITNLRPQRFVAAAAVAPVNGAPPAVVAFASDAAGVQRSANLQLIAMRGSNTAAVRLEGVAVAPENIISSQAPDWLPRVRPAFLGLQCGLSIGLARRSWRQAAQQSGAASRLLQDEIAAVQAVLTQQTQALDQGLRTDRFHTAPAALFELRIGLADTVAQASALELQATGGRAYVLPHGEGFARRGREAAFVPIVTPSLTQLKVALAGQARPAERAA
jgi:alkylation response protein AidB-like acyl-CoA dehydrogenase